MPRKLYAKNPESADVARLREIARKMMGKLEMVVAIDDSAAMHQSYSEQFGDKLPMVETLKRLTDLTLRLEPKEVPQEEQEEREEVLPPGLTPADVVLVQTYIKRNKDRIAWGEKKRDEAIARGEEPPIVW